jgi:3-(3-hydroxy-phenyl)propionate hydroxylase
MAIKHTQAQTIRNKRLLAEQDPSVRRRKNEELRRTSLIASLHEAEAIA